MFLLCVDQGFGLLVQGSLSMMIRKTIVKKNAETPQIRSNRVINPSVASFKTEPLLHQMGIGGL